MTIRRKIAKHWEDAQDRIELIIEQRRSPETYRNTSLKLTMVRRREGAYPLTAPRKSIIGHLRGGVFGGPLMANAPRAVHRVLPAGNLPCSWKVFQQLRNLF